MHSPPPEPPLLQLMLPNAADPESYNRCHGSGSVFTSCSRSSTPPAAVSAAAAAAAFGAAVLSLYLAPRIATLPVPVRATAPPAAAALLL